MFFVDENGCKWWFLNGKHHRENGPAIEYPSGSEAWYLNGKLHRENGPAVECEAWYLNGKHYSESDYWKVLNK